ncbi:MAG TPA: PorV/PorQ family protein [bacterium]|nr:PorV/PorQ family protein [bacterium]HOH08552.1 PorV/PorQ family protein [bacterium]HOY45055.1 PorV/PorQ family protein [bacterium]HPG83051.1 PorV/PorQ family protein [bacterium]HPM59950.1 PorV/PorQ family protein [bacterium]
MRYAISIGLLLLALATTGNAQFETDVSGVGTSAGTFLEIGVGARAQAMGGAYAALSNDPSGLYYNPAGIVWVKNAQLEVMHNEWLVGTRYDFVGLLLPLPFLNSTLGTNLIMLDYGEQPVRTVERPEGTGELWDARDYTVGLTWALALTDRFSFGLTGKYVSQKIWHETGSAMAIDLGIHYNTMLKGLKLGLAMCNFGNEIGLRGRDLDTSVDPDEKNENIDRVPAEYKTGTYPLPLLFRFGIAYERELGRFGTALVTVDVNHPSNSTESVNLGAEYGVAGLFYLRGGYANLFEKDRSNGLTLGGGLDYYRRGSMGFRIDYAWSDWGILEESHRFSVGILFP